PRRAWLQPCDQECGHAERYQGWQARQDCRLGRGLTAGGKAANPRQAAASNSRYQAIPHSPGRPPRRATWLISSHHAHLLAKKDDFSVHYLSTRTLLRNTLLLRGIRRFGFKSRRSEFAYRTFQRPEWKQASSRQMTSTSFFNHAIRDTGRREPNPLQVVSTGPVAYRLHHQPRQASQPAHRRAPGRSS